MGPQVLNTDTGAAEDLGGAAGHSPRDVLRPFTVGCACLPASRSITERRSCRVVLCRCKDGRHEDCRRPRMPADCAQRTGNEPHGEVRRCASLGGASYTHRLRLALPRSSLNGGVEGLLQTSSLTSTPSSNVYCKMAVPLPKQASEGVRGLVNDGLSFRLRKTW